MQVLHDNVDQVDWLTSHLPAAYQEPLPRATLDGINARFVTYTERSDSADAAAEEFAALFSGLCDTMENPEYLTPDGDVMTFLTDVLMLLPHSDAADEASVSWVFVGVPMRCIGSLTACVRRKLRKLRRRCRRSKAWAEESARLADAPHSAPLAAARGAKVAEDMVVVLGESPDDVDGGGGGGVGVGVIGALANPLRFPLVRVGGRRVRSQAEAEEALRGARCGPSGHVELGFLLAEDDAAAAAAAAELNSPLSNVSAALSRETSFLSRQPSSASR